MYAQNQTILFCLTQGNSMQACRSQARLSKRMDRVQQEMLKKRKAQKDKMDAMIKEWETYYDPEKNRVVDKKTGKVLDLRKFSLVEREMILCRVRGGSWLGSECRGNILKAQDSSEKVKHKNYMGAMYSKLKTNDKENWQQLNSQLSQKEEQRKILSKARKLYRKLQKYGVNVAEYQGYYYVVEADGSLNPVDAYEASVIFQEALESGKSEEEAQKMVALFQQEQVKQANELAQSEAAAQVQVDSATDTSVAIEESSSNASTSQADAKAWAQLAAIMQELGLNEQEEAEIVGLIESGQYTLEQTIQILSAPAPAQ